MLQDRELRWSLDDVVASLTLSEQSEDGDSSATASSTNIYILRILFEILTAIPPHIRLVLTAEEVESASKSKESVLLIGQAVLAAVKVMHRSRHFKGTFVLADHIARILQMLDPEFCAKVDAENRAVAACRILQEGARHVEAVGDALLRFLPLCNSVITYLATQVSSGDEDGLSEEIADNLIAVVVVLYGVEIVVNQHDTNLGSPYLDIVMRCLMLKKHWVLKMVSSLVLFLDICPTSCASDEKMCATQKSFYSSFSDISGINDAEMRDLVLCSLVRPEILRVLVLNVMLQCEVSHDKVGGPVEFTCESDTQAFELCSVLLAVSKQDLDDMKTCHDEYTDADLCEWGVLLCPLKTLCWRLFGDADTIREETSKSILLFTSQLEEMCAVSSSRVVREMYGQSLVMGLLTRSSTRHCYSFFKLSHEVAEGGVSGSRRVKEYDMNAEVLPLLAWSECKDKRGQNSSNSPLHPAVSSNSHANYRKLASIAFGEGDLQVRGSALQQMNAMVARDAAILTTLDAVWCLNICERAIWAAANFSPRQAHEINSMATVGEEEDEWGLQCLILLHNVLVHVPYIRSRVTIMPSRAGDVVGDSLNLSFVLDAVLEFHSLPFKLRSTTQVVIGRTKNRVLYVSLCYDILSVWAFSLDGRSLWTLPISTQRDVLASYEVQYETCETCKHAAVLVPEFVWEDFLCVDILQAADLMTSKFIAPKVVARSALCVVPTKAALDYSHLVTAVSGDQDNVESIR